MKPSVSPEVVFGTGTRKAEKLRRAREAARLVLDTVSAPATIRGNAYEAERSVTDSIGSDTIDKGKSLDFSFHEQLLSGVVLESPTKHGGSIRAEGKRTDGERRATSGTNWHLAIESATGNHAEFDVSVPNIYGNKGKLIVKPIGPKTGRVYDGLGHYNQRAVAEMYETVGIAFATLNEARMGGTLAVTPAAEAVQHA
jgi:hypothetical protein